MSENVLELNGKRYDALTGKMLGASHTRVAESLAPSLPARAKKGVIDGIRPPLKPHHVTKSKTAPKSDDTHVAVKVLPKPATKPTPVEHTRTHARAKAATAHQPQHAKTLMRRSVHKPTVTIKPKLKAQLPAEVAAKTPSAIILKHSVSQVDPRRQAHAKAVGKHQAIQRFRPQRVEISSVSMPIDTTERAVPIISVQPAPPMELHSRPAQHKDIFEAAMAHATSHQEPEHKHARHHSRKRRLANVTAGVAAFLVIGSFFAWLNMPNIQLQVASVRAGFKAEMPDYRPTGYAMEGGVQRFGNTVSMSFRSGSSKFQLTQQPSDWNSQTLLENTLALSGDHETVQVGGRTVYIYGDGNAAWVDGGVRFDLTGNASLNANDITQIVNSL